MTGRQRLIEFASEIGYSVQINDREYLYLLPGGYGRPALAETDQAARRITVAAGRQSPDAIDTILRHELTHALGETVVPRSTEEIRLNQRCGNDQPWWWAREAEDPAIGRIT